MKYRKALIQSVLLALSFTTASAEPPANGIHGCLQPAHEESRGNTIDRSTQAASLRAESLDDYNRRMQWFADAQYGMFIHFGVFSHLGGEWKGEPVPWYCEWLQASKKIPREEYATAIKEFNPRKFDADFIARCAKAAGMKYLVITSKHHEGFCLWDSKFTEFDVGSTPFKGRDILAELGKACQRHGLKFGIYYSIIDWHHPAQKPANPDGDPFGGWGQTVIEDGKKDEYIAYQTNQVLELIKNYHPAMLWFDGDWTGWWTMDDGIKLYNTIRNADPKIIVNNRVAKRTGFELDFVTQEQEHFSEAFPKHWEACYTMNDSWGFKKGDNNWKSAQTVYDHLKDINEKGGNLL